MGISLQEIDAINEELREEVMLEYRYVEEPPPEWLVQNKIDAKKPSWLRQAEIQARALQREDERLRKKKGPPEIESIEIRVLE
jgi:hypothetical protein